MSSAAIQNKIKLVDDVANKFENSLSCVIVDYRGLTVSEVTELRKNLREEGIEFKVIKNNISKRAATQAGYEGLAELFKGPNAIAFSADDAVAPARVLHDFSKDHEKLELKGGFIENNIATIEQIKEVAALPNRDGMLSMLLSVLQAPIRNFAYAVKAISEQDENGGTEEEVAE